RPATGTKKPLRLCQWSRCNPLRHCDEAALRPELLLGLASYPPRRFSPRIAEWSKASARMAVAERAKGLAAQTARLKGTGRPKTPSALALLAAGTTPRNHSQVPTSGLRSNNS